MAGLMNPAPEPEPQDMPPAAPEAAGAPPDAVQATPEEEEQNAEFVARAQMAVYDKAMFPKILDMLDVEDAKEALGETAALIVKRVYDMGKGAGREFSPDVILNAAKEIYEDLADISSKFGFIDFEADPDAFDGGFYLMMDAIRVMAQEEGSLDMDSVQAEFEALAAEDRAAGGEQAPPEAEEPGPQPAAKRGLL